MMYIYVLRSLKSVDDLIVDFAALAVQAEEGLGFPINPRPSIRRMRGGIAEVTLFRFDAPDDETPDTINRWNYFDEHGGIVEGKAIGATLRATAIDTIVTISCHSDEYLLAFRWLLAEFGEIFPDIPEPAESINGDCDGSEEDETQ